MKTKTVLATFKGHNGSLGFETNKEYKIEIKKEENGYIHIHDVDANHKRDMACEYESIISFLNNWSSIKHIDELSTINYIKKLTELQKEVGYEKGKINNVALLGLFGEAGEVLNECSYSGAETIDIMDKSVLLNNAIRISQQVDSLKKDIRDKKTNPMLISITDEEKFDNEMADVLYYLNALAINRGKTLNDYAEISHYKVMSYKQQKDIRHANISHGTKSE
jgi:NTP pyrophosphatase (non-canonical NTP hydrolase)